MIKKFYYYSLAIITINYGSNAQYVPGLNEITTHQKHYGDIITDIDNEFDDLASSDLSDYGLSWDGKFYYDSSFTQLVAEPYTVSENDTFYVNLQDVSGTLLLIGLNLLDTRTTGNILNDLDESALYDVNNNQITICQSRSSYDSTTGVTTAVCSLPVYKITADFIDGDYVAIHLPTTVQKLWKFALHYEQDHIIVYAGTVTLFKSIINEDSNPWWNSGTNGECPDTSCIQAVCSDGTILFLNSTILPIYVNGVLKTLSELPALFNQ